MSFIPYVNADMRKDELNRQQRKKFPRLKKVITFSKIRRLKNDMVAIFLQSPTIFDGFEKIAADYEKKVVEGNDSMDRIDALINNEDRTYSKKARDELNENEN